jgi:uncharacterized FlaG/YvyC family protein
MEIDAIGRNLPVLGIDITPKTPEEAAAREVISAVRAANQAQLFGDNRELSFTRDSRTQTPVVRIKDRNTGEVLQQIPPEHLLQMLAELQAQRRTTKASA